MFVVDIEHVFFHREKVRLFRCFILREPEILLSWSSLLFVYCSLFVDSSSEPLFSELGQFLLTFWLWVGQVISKRA